mmetsp:Transcript_52584/g.136175  ORF Transcript_52584/g.136175 Transcript_52584/m.136175 type:complete len:105 (-) Transcript_52584:358-672(-)
MCCHQWRECSTSASIAWMASLALTGRRSSGHAQRSVSTAVHAHAVMFYCSNIDSVLVVCLEPSEKARASRSAFDQEAGSRALRTPSVAGLPHGVGLHSRAAHSI